eukprot:8413992-Pyramimonas_sp.AAC.1
MRLGIEFGTGLIDVEAFYDSMSWEALVDTSLRLQFPATVLGLEFQNCVAPRALAQDGCFSTAFQPSRSIVQGILSGVRFGRCM